MRFELRHAFSCDPDTLWALLEEADFDARLSAATGAERVVVSRTTSGGEEHVVRRISMKRDLPAAMKKVVGSEKITYDQLTWRREGSESLRWEIRPMVLADRFQGRGTTVVRATPGGCERVIAGDLTIRVPLLGGAMEKKLVDDVSASYEQAARIAAQMLRERANGG
jgi:hypothetical protein